MGSYEPVAALLRGLDVLHCLNEHGPMTVGQLHDRTGIAKPTVVRVLETLAHAGYVMVHPAERRYAVTARVMTLSNGYQAQSHLLAVATPILERHRQAAGWPIELGVFDQDAMVILDTSRTPGYLSVNTRPGSRVPVLHTALGRAYLAALPETELTLLLANLATRPAAEFDAARAPDDLHRQLIATRERAYAMADTEHPLTNGRAVACAVVHGGRPVASVNVVVHVSAMPLKTFEQEQGQAIRALASEIATALM